MKIKYLLIYLLLIGCTHRIEKTNDPIEKSEYILNAISNEKYELVRNQFVGRKESIEKNKGTLDTLSMEIYDAIKKYGLPTRNQIIVIGKEKLGIPKDYGDEFNGDLVNVISTKITLGQKKEFVITMGFVIEKNEVRLLRMGADDLTKDSHLR
jgi:hypothetical protein